MFAPLLAVALVTVLPVVPPQEDPARLLPADTIVYFGTNSLRTSSEASSKTAMSKILGEAEVRAFLHEPTAAAQHVLESLLGQARAQIEEQGDELGLPADLELSLDLGSSSEPMPFGQAFLALTHVQVPGLTAPPDAPPDVGLVLGLELLDEDHRALLKTLWSAIPWQEQMSSHAGVSILAKMDTSAQGEAADAGAATAMGVRLAFLGQMAVLSVSETTLHGIIERSQDSTGSLAQSTDYREVLASAGGLVKGGSSSFVRVPGLASLCRTGLAMWLSKEGDVTQEQLGQIMGLFDELGFASIRSVGSVSHVDGEGRIHTTEVRAVDPNGGGLMPALLRSGEPVDVGLLAEVPGSAMSASAGWQGSQAVDVYDFAMSAFEMLAPEEAEQAKQTVAGFMGGSDLREDVLANVVGRVLSFTVEGQGLPGTPDSIIRMGVRDGTRFVTAAQNLIASVGGPNGLGFPLKLKETEHESVAVYELDVSATPLGMSGMQPGFAVREGEIVFSNSVKRLKVFLDGALGAGEASLAENAGMAAFVGSLAEKGGVQTWTFSDNGRNFSTMYGQIAPALGMLMGSVGDVPVDISKLPSDQAISKHLDVTYVGSYAREGGVSVTRSIGQFQVSDMLPLLLVGTILGIGAGEGVDFEEAKAADPRQLAEADLRQLKASITVYKVYHPERAYPSSLEDLKAPLPELPEGAYQHGPLPSDPWGNPYHFVMEKHVEKDRLMPKLWSAGPNGVDEQGSADDIVVF